MADSYTSFLKLLKMAQGDHSPAWASLQNAGTIDLADDAIDGLRTINVASSTSYNLAALASGADAESRSRILKFTGTPASALTVTVPASVTSKHYAIINAVGQTLTIKYAATAGVIFQSGEVGDVYCDGTTVLLKAKGQLRTAGEIAASVTPTDYSYPVGDAASGHRYSGLAATVAQFDAFGQFYNPFGADVSLASAATTNLGSLATHMITVTGVTTITSFGSSASLYSPIYLVKFSGILTLTHNGASLILPGAANITTAANDVALLEYLGSGNWRCLQYWLATAITALTTATGMKQGLVTLPVMASAMTPATTNGPSSATIETATNKQNYKTLDFDTTTQEFAHFQIPMPKSWNNGTVTFQPIWTFASSSGTVEWALQGVACSDGDTIDAAWGTEQLSNDTALTAGQIHIGPTSSAITIAGTPATSDLIFFRVKRNPAGTDTLAADARLIGIRLFFTQNAADDS